MTIVPYWNLYLVKITIVDKCIFVHRLIMKTYTTVALMGVIFAAGLGVATVSGVPVTLNQAGISTMEAETSGMYGHITLIAHGPDGEVKEYRQTDNTVLRDGEDCLAQAIFSITAGSENCDVTSKMTYIGIGNGENAGSDDSAGSEGSTQPPDTAETLNNEIASDPQDSATVTASSGSGSSTVISLAIPINSTFAITEAILANSGVNDTDGSYDALALQEFNAINLSNGDTLTVEWTIQLGS